MQSEIILGDAGDVLQGLPDESVDLVFTDPPYPRKHKHVYWYLAEYCPRLMKPGASLVTIVPHYLLEEVIGMFNGKLKFRWILNMSQIDGSHARMSMGIEVGWKPMLWYVKGSYPHGRGFLRDWVEIKGTDGIKKKRHIWEQDKDWATYYISKLTKPGDVVLDPYFGSGTVGLVCKHLGRNYIGIDNDPVAIDVARKRLQEVENGKEKEQDHDQAIP